MKNTIRLILAVLFGLTVFCVSASAEEYLDSSLPAETAADSVTVTDEEFKSDDEPLDAAAPEETAEESDETVSEEATVSDEPLVDSFIVTDNNETADFSDNEIILPAGNLEENTDGNPEGNPDGNPDENPDDIISENPSDPEGETPDTPSDTAPSDGEEQESSDAFVLSGKDIPVQNGIYSYELIVRPQGTLTFDNYLENTYQGVDGKFKLHYDIEETGNHIMIAAGKFKNIITASPLFIIHRDLITEDTYSYKLDLRTNEGFTFTNNLRYLVNGEKHGYSIYYDYDMLTSTQTIEIGSPHDEDEDPSFTQQKNRPQKLMSILSRIFNSFKLPGIR